MKQLTENIKSILGIMIVTLSFAYVFIITIFGFKPDAQVIIFIVGSCTGVINYFLGSSAGGAKKDEIISSMAQNASSQTPTELTLPEEPIKVDLTKNK